MKRSKSIKLVLLGSVSVAALTGCGGNEQTADRQVFQDEAQCARENDAAACAEALQAARVEHAQTAPAFTSRASCEAKFGAENCGATEGVPSAQQLAQGGDTGATQNAAGEQTAHSGMGFFMPMLLGYTMGNMMGGRAMGQPVWRDARNTAYVGGRPSGTVDSAAMARARASGTPVSVSRGGFGARSFGSSAS